MKYYISKYQNPADTLHQTNHFSEKLKNSIANKISDFIQTPVGTWLVRTYPVKKVLEIGAKAVRNPQGKTDSEIISDFAKGNKSFYSVDRKNGSNEIDTYLFQKPYNTEFQGNDTIGPQYDKYIEREFPEFKGNIKTYNTRFGDTLYVDNSAKPYINSILNSKHHVGMRQGVMGDFPSYIKTTEDDRPYDAGGHLATFSEKDGKVVANMSDIYQFDGTKEDYNKSGNGGFIHTVALSAMNKAGKPFIVRQNEIPVVFKDILPQDYKSELQLKLGKFLANFGDTYDLNIPKKLSDDQILEIFTHKPELSGDDILEFMRNKSYIK